MPVKIRLARRGKKGYPFYHIIVADSRAPRDGKFIEQIGTYNPNTNPATISLQFDKAVDWLNKGAQPTDTARTILSYKGVMYKKHLLGGVQKGAFTAEQADEKFNKWMSEKEAQINAKRAKLADAKGSAAADRLAAEAKVNEERAKALAAKKSEAIAAAKAENAAEEAAEQEVAVAEEAAPVVEAPAVVEAAPVVEAPVAEEAALVVEAPAVVEAAPVVEAPVVEEAAPAVIDEVIAETTEPTVDTTVDAGQATAADAVEADAAKAE